MIKLHNKLLCALIIISLISSLCAFSTGTAFAKTSLSNPVSTGNGYKWDCIYFGSYEQNWNSSKSYFVKSPIKWRVLNISGNKALLLADSNILNFKFHNNSLTQGYKSRWDNSILRTMLNGYDDSYNSKKKDYTGIGFLDLAFSADERKAILSTTLDDQDTTDKIFALSKDEASNSKYGLSGTESRKVRTISDQVIDNYKNSKYKNTLPYDWFTRTVATDSGYDRVYMVDSNGSLKQVSIEQDAIGIRPAMYIDLTKANWSNAGTVTSAGTVDENGAINPGNTNTITVGKTSITSLKAAKKAFTVKWKKTSCTGYQIRYSLKSNMKSAKTVKITKATTCSRKITKLKSKKKYYVQVRAYKKSGKKTYYSKWSAQKSVKTK